MAFTSFRNGKLTKIQNSLLLKKDGKFERVMIKAAMAFFLLHFFFYFVFVRLQEEIHDQDYKRTAKRVRSLETYTKLTGKIPKLFGHNKRQFKSNSLFCLYEMNV